MSEQVKRELNPKQELFCNLYATEREFFGNGVQSYIEAYNPDRTSPSWYKSSLSSAADLLVNPNILTRINELLEQGGFNDEFADKQLSFLMTQNADLTNKLGALKEYNKLKARIADKLEVKHDLTPEAIQALERLAKAKENQK